MIIIRADVRWFPLQQLPCRTLSHDGVRDRDRDGG